MNGLKLRTPCPIQPITHPVLGERGVELHVLRDDLNHPLVPGNKARKLKYNLQAASNDNHTRLLTFGGAYSNHIRATAAAGRTYGLETIGVIRGEKTLPLNPALSFAASQGMKFHYMDRTTYRRKAEPEVVSELLRLYGRCYVVPEGGSNALAVKGVSELVSEEIRGSYDTVCCACGTGGTLAGLISGMQGNGHVLGVSVLKGGNFLASKVERLLSGSGCRKQDNWDLELDCHFGGYAKKSARLEEFLREAGELNAHVPFEPIYTGRCLYGILKRVKDGTFEKGSKILMVHTGGIHDNSHSSTAAIAT